MTTNEQLFSMFKHLIESLEDAQTDPYVLDMVNDALVAFEESLQLEEQLED